MCAPKPGAADKFKFGRRRAAGPEFFAAQAEKNLSAFQRKVRAKERSLLLRTAGISCVRPCLKRRTAGSFLSGPKRIAALPKHLTSPCDLHTPKSIFRNASCPRASQFPFRGTFFKKESNTKGDVRAAFLRPATRCFALLRKVRSSRSAAAVQALFEKDHSRDLFQRRLIDFLPDGMGTGVTGKRGLRKGTPSP